MKKFSRRAVKPWVYRAGALATLALPLSACDGLLDVTDPDKVTPDALEGEAGIPLRVAGALADLQVGFSGSGLQEGLVPAGGLFTDEFYLSDTFPTRIEIDTRRINPLSNTETASPYTFMQRARIQAIELARLAAEFEDAGSANLALGRNVEGYSEVLLGEHYCSGVPFSTPVGNEIEEGEPLTTKQIFERALPRFDAAIAALSAVPANDRDEDQEEQLNLARVGKARTLLNLGRANEAAQAVAAVPTDFEFLVQHSDNTPAQNNSTWALQDNGRLSVANNEGTGGNTLNFRGGDPRVPFVRGTEPDGSAAFGFDGITPLWVQELYEDEGSDIPLASGLEARLIEIEALLNGGNSSAYLAPLNALRASYEHPTLGDMSLPALADPGTPAARVDQFFRERAFFLYLTGHRLGDLRRLIRFYGRTEDDVFPTGNYHKQNRTYGNQTSIPIPFEETNNTRYTECLPTEGF